MNRKCIAVGCDSAHYGCGWCKMHYARWRNGGVRRKPYPPPGRPRHGHGSGTPTYNSWHAMIQRCTNPKNTNYERYGGRGITVCDRWRTFVNFLADMGERPDGTTLDRIDNDRGYCIGNCRWATPVEQTRNQRPRKRKQPEPIGYGPDLEPAAA